MSNGIEIEWMPEPEEPAAESYPSLIYEPKRVRCIVDELRKASITSFDG